MKQLEKKAVLAIGAMMLLLGMGMNLQYALDDYGLAENNAMIAVWAQQPKTGDDGGGTGGTDNPGYEIGAPGTNWKTYKIKCWFESTILGQTSGYWATVSACGKGDGDCWAIAGC